MQRHEHRPKDQEIVLQALAETERPGASRRDRIQRRAKDGRSGRKQQGARDVHASAEAGVSGGGSRLPYLEQIQAAFGHHDVSGVQAHVAGKASDACEEIGAAAYARGEAVAFKGAPDLHTAAHEVAHVVQQRQGVQLKAGIGRSGDSYEQHADRVADLVVSGADAQTLLGTGGGGGSAAVPRNAVQRQDDGKLACELDSVEAPEGDPRLAPFEAGGMKVIPLGREVSGVARKPKEVAVLDAKEALCTPMTPAEAEAFAKENGYVVTFDGEEAVLKTPELPDARYAIRPETAEGVRAGNPGVRRPSISAGDPAEVLAEIHAGQNDRLLRKMPETGLPAEEILACEQLARRDEFYTAVPLALGDASAHVGGSGSGQVAGRIFDAGVAMQGVSPDGEFGLSPPSFTSPEEIKRKLPQGREEECIKKMRRGRGLEPGER